MIAAWHRGDKLCNGLAVSSLLKEGGKSAMCLHSWPNLLGQPYWVKSQFLQLFTWELKGLGSA